MKQSTVMDFKKCSAKLKARQRGAHSECLTADFFAAWNSSDQKDSRKYRPTTAHKG
jgi:hypothetical protein